MLDSAPLHERRRAIQPDSLCRLDPLWRCCFRPTSPSYNPRSTYRHWRDIEASSTAFAHRALPMELLEIPLARDLGRLGFRLVSRCREVRLFVGSPAGPGDSQSSQLRVLPALSARHEGSG